jgi:hypothetical protein
VSWGVGLPTNDIAKFWRIKFGSARARPFTSFRFLTIIIETSQSSRYSGVDKDGFEEGLVSDFAPGTKWGQARASEAPLVQEPNGPRMMGSHLTSASRYW